MNEMSQTSLWSDRQGWFHTPAPPPSPALELRVSPFRGRDRKPSVRRLWDPKERLPLAAGPR